MTELEKYAKRLGIKIPKTTASPIDIEAGKAGYEKYLADSANVETDKKWWQIFKPKYNAVPSLIPGESSNVDSSAGVLKKAFGMLRAQGKYTAEQEFERPQDDWTDEEKWAFGEKYAKSKTEAYEFAKKLNQEHAQKSKEDKAKKIEEWTDKNAANRVLGSAASLATNAFAGGVGYLDTLIQKGVYGDVYERDFLYPHEVANTMQGTVASHLNDKYGTLEGDGVFGGKGVGDIYGLGMSIGQSMLAGVTGGVGMASMFSMAASNATSDAISRGVSSDKAIAIGTIAGAAEMALEKISFEKLLGITSKEGVQNVLKNVLKQAGQEAAEEGATTVINEFADRWIAADKSNYQLMINQFMAQGMTREQAEQKAGKQFVNGLIYDTIAGAASGGISGAAATAINRGVNQFGLTKDARTANKNALEAYTPIQNDLIAEGKQHKASEKVATMMESKLAKGKELSGYNLRTLAYETQNAQRTADVETTRNAIVEKMKAEGLDESKAKKLGEIALNKAIGHDISKLQEVQLKNNEIASKVYNQISQEVMDSGVGESDWARATPIESLREELKAEKLAENGGIQENEDTKRKTPETAMQNAEISSEIATAEKLKKMNNAAVSDSAKLDTLNQLVQESKARRKIEEIKAKNAKVDENVLKSSEKNGTIESTNINGGNLNGNQETVHLRDSSKRNRGQDTEGQVSRMESSSGQTESREETARVADREAARIVNEGRKVSTSELGIKGGSTNQNISVVDRSKETSSMKNARKEAEASGLNVTFFAGDNLNITDDAGNQISARAYIKGKNVYVRADHPLYTSEQLMRHELGHDKIAKGEVDIKAVKAKLSKKVGTNNVTLVADLYNEAYAGTGMTAEEIWEECICDSLGEMNIFASDEMAGELFDKILPEISKAAKSTKSPTQTRGSPNGKASRDKFWYPKLTQNEWNLLNRRLDLELETSDNYIDKQTKWLYANSRGTKVFAIYGIGDGTVATVLYAVGGDTAKTLNERRIEYESNINRSERNPYKKSIERLGVQQYQYGNGVNRDGQNDSRTDNGVGQVSPRSQRGHNGGAVLNDSTQGKASRELDTKYLDAVNRGDMKTAQRMVDEAAKANGYTDVVYHGTKAFGFTEFDTEKSDDKRSLFVAGSTELAQTYSGKHGTKKLYDNKNIDGFSNEEVVKMLNAEATQSYEGAEMQTEYDIMTLKDVNNLINEVNDGIDDLQKVLEGKIKEYADKMARDFDDKDAKTHSRLIEANELLKAYEYKRLSTPLYVLLHYTDALESNPEVADLEYKIRLMNKLADADTSNGVVVKKDLGGYGVSVLTFDKAREELKGLISSGNYALYGKPGRRLVIDAKGQNWNNIKNWIQSAYRSTKDTYVKKDDMYYRLYDSDTNEQIFHGRIEITDKNKDMSIDSLHPIMVQKANNVLAIRSEYMHTTRDIAKFAKDEGYDSVKFENLVDNGGAGESVEAGDVYVYFNSSDLKSADPVTYDDNGNVIPISERFNESNKDIRYSRETKPRTTVTTGKYEQTKANLSHSKVYSKKSAMQLVRKIAPGIRNRSFEALSNQLWEGLNANVTIDDKRQFAEDMSQIFIDRMTVDTLVKHSEWDAAVEKMAYLKTGIGAIDFRSQDKSELKYDLDKKYPSLISRWGYKKSRDGSFKRAYGLDEFISDISREMPGMEHLAEMHPAEALLEVDKLYTELSEQIKEKYESAYNEFSEEELNEIRQSIAYEIMNAYTELGDQTKISKYLAEKFEYYQTRIDFWKAENAKTKKISRWHGIISTKALQIKELKKGAFYNATQHHQDVFKDSIEKLANIQWRGNLKPTQRVSEIFADLKQWYTMDNPMLYNSKDADNSLYSDTIATYITKIAESQGAFTEDTYAMVYEVMNHLYTMMRNYNKVFRNGRWEDAPDLADNYLKIMEDAQKKRGPGRRLQEMYNTEFLEPMAVARRADNYNEKGFFTQTMEDLRRASIDASVGEMKLRKEYDAFVDKHKKYLTNAAKDTVKYRGHDIPKIHIIGLYMTMKREHAREGLARNGFEYTIKNKWWDSADYVKVNGYLTDKNATHEMVNEATEAEMRTIEKLFTEIDKQYIEVLEKLFNEDLKRLKVERDMERQGYTNATLDYYYPIIRGAMAENIDTARISDQNRATNASFNKNTVQGAQQRLVIISADAMVNRHINDMCKYYYMSQAIENYNVLYNCDTSGNPNDPINIARLVKENKIWEKDVQYFKKLVSDMQGIRDPQSIAEKALESLRGKYAAFALGLNVKVLFTQFSSMIAAGDVLGFGSILSPKALTVTSADIDTYCPLAAVRNYDAAVIKAMSVSDKVGKVSKALTWGIGKVDRLVVRRLFAACQVEVQKRGQGELGTEQNKVAAGKLLEQVIIETQQNSYATERSQAMRSNNEVLKSMTMFTADGMKVISRMYDAFGELRTAKKSGDKVKIKKARKKLAKSIAVAVNIAVYMTAIACLFNWIYDRDDEEEDEEKLLSLTMDTIGNFISALPILSDLYDFMVDGFEVESPIMDTINNIFSGINNIRKDAVSIVIKRDGERSMQDINRDLRTMLYGVGQATGIPFRNAYNLARGFIGNFTKTGGYKLDAKFYETSLASDLEDAIEKGDNYKASYVMSLIYDERVDKSVSQKQIDEIVRLSKLDHKGYNIIPKTIPDKVTRNEIEYKLTASQKDIISSEYSKVTNEIDKLISSEFYRKLSNEDKMYMIDYYHDQFYNRAVNKALKLTNKTTIVSDIIGFGKYAEVKFLTKDIESDKDKNGNAISGSKKEKVIKAINKTSMSTEKKLLYIASLGYSLTEKEEKKLIKYLNSLKLGVSTKKNLAEMLGFKYKNGKITAKS